jgi:hypothetical protein
MMRPLSPDQVLLLLDSDRLAAARSILFGKTSPVIHGQFKDSIVHLTSRKTVRFATTIKEV